MTGDLKHNMSRDAGLASRKLVTRSGSLDMAHSLNGTFQAELQCLRYNTTVSTCDEVATHTVLQVPWHSQQFPVRTVRLQDLAFRGASASVVPVREGVSCSYCKQLLQEVQRLPEKF